MRTMFVILALAVSLGPASAQGGAGDEIVRKAIQVALDNIHRGRCGTGNCAPATAAEKANPPLSLAEGRAVTLRAMTSARGAHCGLDWQRENFLPMMNYWRHVRKKSDRQLALIGIVHGAMQDQGRKALVSKGLCTAEQRAQTAKDLPFRP